MHDPEWWLLVGGCLLSIPRIVIWHATGVKLGLWQGDQIGQIGCRQARESRHRKDVTRATAEGTMDDYVNDQPYGELR